MTLTVPIGEGWSLEGTFEWNDRGVPVLRSVRYAAIGAVPAGGLTARMLRGDGLSRLRGEMWRLVNESQAPIPTSSHRREARVR